MSQKVKPCYVKVLQKAQATDGLEANVSFSRCWSCMSLCLCYIPSLTYIATSLRQDFSF